MLWVYGNLSNIERLCINSFLCHGYRPYLWTYGDITNAPNGTILKNANEIIPEKMLFKFMGSYAAFANIFRYAVLSRQGGIWSDSDIVCLKPSTLLPDESFLVEQNTKENTKKINTCLIYSKNPKPGDIIDIAYVMSERFPKDNLAWGDTGPKLLTILHKEYPKISFELVMKPEFCNSINWWECPAILLIPHREMNNKAMFLHLYNEMWARAGIDKNASFIKDSIMDKLANKYL
jgi:mannosyltransferase OCH1-like enzyme